MSDDDEKKGPAKRRIASKSFVDRMTAGDVDVDALDREIEEARQSREVGEGRDSVVLKP
ncbi:MAG: hypothetical protein AAGF48_13935 [Pseudomonadota bacterium]